MASNALAMITSFDALIDFLRRYHRHRLADPSLDPSRIPATLPPPLVTLYRELGALCERDDLDEVAFSAQDQLVPVDLLEFSRSRVTFARENQGNWSARCGLGKRNPKVFSDAGGAGIFEVACPSLEHFLTTLCLQETVMSSAHLLAVDDAVAIDSVLSEPTRPLWLRATYVHGEPTHEFWVSADENAIVMSTHGNLWVGSRDRPVPELLAGGVTNVHELH